MGLLMQHNGARWFWRARHLSRIDLFLLYRPSFGSLELGAHSAGPGERAAHSEGLLFAQEASGLEPHFQGL